MNNQLTLPEKAHTIVLTFEQMHQLLYMKDKIQRRIYRDIDMAIRQTYNWGDKENLKFILYDDPEIMESGKSCVEILNSK